MVFADADFKNAVLNAAAQLEGAQRALRALARPGITSLIADLQGLSAHSIEQLLASVPTGYRKSEKGDDYVYIIQSEGGQKHVAALSTLFAQARNAHADYSRMNRENMPTATLYVGRSKTLRARLRQHLGAEGRGVFSLHLARWAATTHGKVHISMLRFSGTDDLLVQAIEDGLWSFLRPAFGRKGER